MFFLISNRWLNPLLFLAGEHLKKTKQYMIIQLVKTSRGFEIVRDGEKYGDLIEQKKGELPDSYKQRAIAVFDEQVIYLKKFKEDLLPKVIKSANY